MFSVAFMHALLLNFPKSMATCHWKEGAGQDVPDPTVLSSVLFSVAPRNANVCWAEVEEENVLELYATEDLA